MGGGRMRCCLCRKKFGEENVSFFSVPKLPQQRQRWLDLTGINFNPKTVVCQDHFTYKDFINGPGESTRGGRVRLQPGAVPSLNMNSGSDELCSEQRRRPKSESIIPDNIYDSNGELQIPGPTCHICNRSCPKGKIGLYPPPNDSTVHARWNAACGLLLKEWSRVCERHFCSNDFHRTGKRKRLNENAIPSLFLVDHHSADLAQAEVAAAPDTLVQNMDSVDEEPLIDIKSDDCDEENFQFAEYLEEADQNFAAKAAQTSCADAQTCGVIRVKTDKSKIYSVHCFYCDEIFAIWNWPKFVKHLQDQHNDEAADQESDTSELAECSKQSARMRTRSPTPEDVKIEPEFFAVNTMAAAADDEFEESPFETKTKEFDEKVSAPPKIIKVADAFSDEDSEYGCNDSKSDFEDGAKGGKAADSSKKVPLPCHQISFGCDDQATIMDLLELWKNYRVLWYYSPGPKDTFFHAALTKITKKINSNWNLSITEAGMMYSLRRMRKWFQTYKTIEENSTDGKMLKSEFYAKNMWNGKRKNFQVYYEKCSEFLSVHEDRTAFCEKCKCFFVDEEHLQEHALHKHKQYCDICQRDCGSTKTYRQHVKIHLPPKHKCDICSKEYIHQTHLKEHMQAHRNERNFVCEKCGREFVRHKNLQRHKQTRHDAAGRPKKQPCAICNIAFPDWGALSLHRRKCHLVREGTIEELTTAIPNVGKFQKHTYSVDPVTKLRRIVCEVCGNTYARHAGLYRHMVKEHQFVRYQQRIKAEAQQSDSNCVQLKNKQTINRASTVKNRRFSNKMAIEDNESEANIDEEDGSSDYVVENLEDDSDS